jgi:hypothetical protein
MPGLLGSKVEPTPDAVKHGLSPIVSNGRPRRRGVGCESNRAPPWLGVVAVPQSRKVSTLLVSRGVTAWDLRARPPLGAGSALAQEQRRARSRRLHGRVVPG